MNDVPPGYVIVGRVGSPWGVHGDSRVTPFVDKPERLDPGRRVTIGGRLRTIERCRWQKGLAYVKLSGIDSREAAAKLRQELLLVPESELEPLPEGQFYRFQLVGMEVRTQSGQPLGRLTDIITTGANDVYVVDGDSGQVLVPATTEVVKRIDLEEGVMEIEEMPGLLPERHTGQ